jgi:hypothetical protein
MPSSHASGSLLPPVSIASRVPAYFSLAQSSTPPVGHPGMPSGTAGRVPGVVTAGACPIHADGRRADPAGDGQGCGEGEQADPAHGGDLLRS